MKKIPKSINHLFLMSFVLIMLPVCILLTFSGELQAQAEPDTVQAEEPAEIVRITPATSLERTQMEHRLDGLLKNALNNFFDPSTYFVDTQVQLELMRKEVPPDGRTERPETGIRESLPGLPGVPASLLRQQEGRETTTTDLVMELTGITVNIMVDSDYTDEQISFIDQLVRATAKIDQGRGDAVSIMRSEFPRPRPTVTPLPETETDPAETDTITEAPTEESQPDIFAAESNFWWYMAAAAALLIILIIIAVWMSRRKKKKTGAEGRLAGDSLRYLIGPEEEESKTAAASAAATEVNIDSEPESWLLQNMLAYPEEFARLFESWAVKEGDAGLNRAVMFLKRTDPKTVHILRPAMSEHMFKRFSDAVSRSAPVQSSSETGEIKPFCLYLKSRFFTNRLRKGLQPLRDFDFTEHVSDEALTRELESCTPLERAVVIGHLSGVRSSAVLDAFGQSEAREVMRQLPAARKVLYPEYTALADRIFNAINTAETDTGWTEADVRQTVELIETLPPDQQEVYALDMVRENSAFSSEVNSRLITFTTLHKIDDDTLARALESVDSQTLGTALAGLPDETAERILAMRPGREQLIIKNEMESVSDKSSEPVAEARKNVLSAIRKRIRKKQSGVAAYD